MFDVPVSVECTRAFPILFTVWAFVGVFQSLSFILACVGVRGCNCYTTNARHSCLIPLSATTCNPASNLHTCRTYRDQLAWLFSTLLVTYVCPVYHVVIPHTLCNVQHIFPPAAFSTHITRPRNVLCVLTGVSPPAKYSSNTYVPLVSRRVLVHLYIRMFLLMLVSLPVATHAGASWCRCSCI